MPVAARSGGSWQSPTKAWVRHNGAWVPLWRAYCRDGGAWTGAAYTGVPEVVGASVTSGTSNYAQTTLSWSYGGGATSARVSQYTYSDATGSNETLVPGSTTTTTATSISYPTNTDTYYAYKIVPIRDGVEGAQVSVRYRVGHPSSTTTYYTYQWAILSSDLRIDSTWTSASVVSANVNGTSVATTSDPSNPLSYATDASDTTGWILNHIHSGVNSNDAATREVWSPPASARLRFTAPATVTPMLVYGVTVKWLGRAFAVPFGSNYLLYTGRSRFVVKGFRSNGTTQVGDGIAPEGRIKTLSEVQARGVANGTSIYQTPGMEVGSASSQIPSTGNYIELNPGNPDAASIVEVDNNNIWSSWDWGGSPAGNRFRSSLVSVTLTGWLQEAVPNYVTNPAVTNSSW